MSLRVTMYIIVSIIFTACTNSKQNINNSIAINEIPKHQVPKRTLPPKKKSKGSLFSNQGGSLFSDRKNLQIGDIILVTISETPTVETKSTKNTTRDADTQTLKGGSITTVDKTPSLIKTAASAVNGIIGIGATFPSLTRDFNAVASSKIEDKFVNQVSAVITQHFQNGNYFIEGSKDVVVNGQKQTLKISGVVSPYDIPANNTLDAKYIANLKVIYYKAGDEEQYMEKNWGHKVLETVSPF